MFLAISTHLSFNLFKQNKYLLSFLPFSSGNALFLPNKVDFLGFYYVKFHYMFMLNGTFF